MDNRRLRPGAAAQGQAPWGAGDGGRLRALMAQLLGRSGGNALHVLSSLLEARLALSSTMRRASQKPTWWHQGSALLDLRVSYGGRALRCCILQHSR